MQRTPVQIHRDSCWLLGEVEQRCKPCWELGWMGQGTRSSGEMAKSVVEGEKMQVSNFCVSPKALSLLITAEPAGSVPQPKANCSSRNSPSSAGPHLPIIWYFLK